MKNIKMFSLDPDLIDKLKQEQNASELVSNLLYRHYASVNPDERVQELTQEMAKYQRAKEEYDRIIKEKQDLEADKEATNQAKVDWEAKNKAYREEMRALFEKEGIL